jgi:hypothetical protein
MDSRGTIFLIVDVEVTILMNQYHAFVPLTSSCSVSLHAAEAFGVKAVLFAAARP